VTPEERRLLTDLATKVSQTPPPARDPEAEDFIRKNIGSRPDALYLMTQTVLIQNIAIEQAQQQIRELQQRAPQPSYQSGASGSSFLGQTQQYSPPQQPQYAPPPAVPAPAGGGFLRGAMETAAGVAAGALAFEGVRSLFSHPSYGLGGGGLGFGESGLMGGGRPMEETVINNNYYDSPGAEHHTGERPVDDKDDILSDSDDDRGQAQDVDYDDTDNSDDSSDDVA
jgi:hypothetical protein